MDTNKLSVLIASTNNVAQLNEIKDMISVEVAKLERLISELRQAMRYYDHEFREFYNYEEIAMYTKVNDSRRLRLTWNIESIYQKLTALSV